MKRSYRHQTVCGRWADAPPSLCRMYFKACSSSEQHFASINSKLLSELWKVSGPWRLWLHCAGFLRRYCFRCEEETKMRDTTCSQLRSTFCFLLEINCDLWTLSCGRPTHPDVQPHIRRHPQSDRQIGKCITGVSPQAHARGCACARAHTRRRPTHPVIHSPLPCLLMAITALQQSTPAFLRFLRPGTILCALQK